LTILDWQEVNCKALRLILPPQPISVF